jgi:tripartite-type tricarboxylate transporter receptor subunit TctC
MNRLLSPALWGAGALALVLGQAGLARADAVTDFYKGRTLNVAVAFAPGGGYDIYARSFAQYMGKYIPGNPTLIPQFMPGAGGAKAANYLATVAPHDGTVVALLSNSVALAQVITPKEAHYDASKFIWLGRMADMRSAILVWHTAGVKTIEDMKTKQVIFGGTGKSSQDYMNPMLMKNVLGLKAKIVSGYRGSNEINLAMEKGEVQAMSNSWGSVRTRLGHWLTSKQALPIAMVGLTPAPDLPDVPLVMNLAKNDEDKAVLKLMASTTELGRAFAAPAGVPADRVAALRAAFKQMMDDKTFLAEAKSRKMDVEYLAPDAVEKVVAETVHASPKVVARFKEALELK